MLTLDTNGCWNGNCNDYIIIINDDSSTTLPIDTTTSVFQPPLQEELSTIKAYPNPTSSVVRLEFEAPGMYLIRVLDENGRLEARTKVVVQ